MKLNLQSIILGMGVVALSSLNSCQHSEEKLTNYNQQRNQNTTTTNYNPIKKPVKDISHFSDDNILIVCENKTEYDGVVQTLHTRNNLRAKNYKMSFTPRDDYMKVTMPNKEGEVIKNSYIHVVTKDKATDHVFKMRQQNIHYDIIQLRGHDKQMKGLYNLTKTAGDNRNTIFFFGGCNSYNFAKEKEEENRATIGGQGMQESSRNTFYLVRLIDEMGTADVNSWATLNNKLNESDSKFNQFYFPK
jgi:hypothetical protein